MAEYGEVFSNNYIKQRPSSNFPHGGMYADGNNTLDTVGVEAVKFSNYFIL